MLAYSHHNANMLMFAMSAILNIIITLISTMGDLRELDMMTFSLKGQETVF